MIVDEEKVFEGIENNNIDFVLNLQPCMNKKEEKKKKGGVFLVPHRKNLEGPKM